MPSEAQRLVLEALLPYRLNQAAERVSRRFAAVYRSECGLTRPEWRTLATIGQMAIATATATAIGRRSSMHKTRVSRAVFALKRRWPTRQGRRQYAALVKLALAFERGLEQQLGETAKIGLADGLSALERLSSPP